MEICKNKMTGQPFIHITEKDHKRSLMITPHGDIKALEMELFTEPIYVEDEGISRESAGVTLEQYATYRQYMQTDQ
jgi:hypothetical protein